MMQPPGGVPTELPLWKGRRGVVNAVMCFVLALPCAFGLWFFAERSTIVPACSGYAAGHAMTYSDFKLVGVKHASTVVCLLERSNGEKRDVHLDELVPYVTNLWVEFAMSLEITVPGFAVLLGLVRVGLYRLGTRTAA